MVYFFFPFPFKTYRSIQNFNNYCYDNAGYGVLPRICILFSKDLLKLLQAVSDTRASSGSYMSV